ncbi:MAG: DUF4157 domain-containing protein, partial [Chloroflexota bacterium]
THGNAYVQRLLDSKKVQAKLTVNPPNDEYEQEANRVAEAVASGPDASIQRQEEEEEELLQTKRDSSGPTGLQRQEEEEEEELLQREPDSPEPASTSDSLEQRIDAARGSGQPLGESARASLEPRLGADLSDVRVHTDADADDMSRQLNAKAFTTGKNVFFRDGDYQPGTSEGQKLLAHELTHVAQQSEGSRVPGKGVARPPASHEAQGGTAAPTARSKGVPVARQEEADVSIARQPVEVKPEETSAKPPPATPAPPVSKDAARLAAMRAMWESAIELHLKEASEILQSKGAGKKQAREAFNKLVVVTSIVQPMMRAYEGQEPISKLLVAFDHEISRLGSMLEPHFHALHSLPSIGSLVDPKKNLSFLLKRIRGSL